MTDEQALQFEQMTDDGPVNETVISLRAYFTRMPDEKLDQYDRAWSDEQVIQWDGNFRNDGELMLICCEDDVEIPEYRRVLEKHIAFRKKNAGCV